MMIEPAMLENRRFKAPTRHKQTLHDPGPSELDSLWQNNLAQIDAFDFTINGKSIQPLRLQAKQDCKQLALDYTRNRLRIDADFDIATSIELVFGGHQPELFHPGVWYKNFLLDRVARRFDAQGINLVVDNDVSTSVGIYVPSGDMENPRRRWVPLDRKQSAIPFEHRPVFDPDFFAGFPERVNSLGTLLSNDCLVESLWNLQPELSPDGKPTNLARQISGARAQLEHKHGIANLELPVSQLCRFNAFADFFAEILTRHQEFTIAYNQSLFDYQLDNGIKSASHPVPPLELRDQWQELPFWMWTDNDQVRRRLFARFDVDQILLSALSNSNDVLHLSLNSVGESFLALESQGIYIRPRALTMTMFVRLCLGELFIHGIGGAKYDQMTDAIIRRFFDVEPPQYLTATATFRLPCANTRASTEDLQQLSLRRRELTWHPEKFIAKGGEGEATLLAKSKRKLVNHLQEQRANHVEYAEIQRFNKRLSQLLAQESRSLDEQIDTARQLDRISRVLNWREYSFCLHRPELVDWLKNETLQLVRSL